MTKLINELEAQHQGILESLNTIQKVSAFSKEGQKELQAMKKNLIAHIQKEDRELYPVLNKAAEADPALKRSLGAYIKDMEEISQVTLAFFDKYANGGDGIEFAKDFGKLYAVLTRRLRKEESTMYKKYGELNAA